MDSQPQIVIILCSFILLFLTLLLFLNKYYKSSGEIIIDKKYIKRFWSQGYNELTNEDAYRLLSILNMEYGKSIELQFLPIKETYVCACAYRVANTIRVNTAFKNTGNSIRCCCSDIVIMHEFTHFLIEDKHNFWDQLEVHHKGFEQKENEVRSKVGFV